MIDNNTILGRMSCPNCGITRGTDMSPCVCGYNPLTGKVEDPLAPLREAMSNTPVEKVDMKKQLTLEESAELTKHGVSAFKATIFHNGGDLGFGPVFTLEDILSLIPSSERDSGGLMIGFDVERGQWACSYEFSASIFRADELIDALLKLAIFLLDNHIELN